MFRMDLHYLNISLKHLKTLNLCFQFSEIKACLAVSSLRFDSIPRTTLMLVALVKRKRAYLQVALGGERLLAHGASERLVAGVSTHVYLQGRAGGEVLIAHVTQVLTGLQACKHTHNTHEAHNRLVSASG